MDKLNHWLVGLDLSKMDDILIGYTNFLTSVITPKTITFFHVIRSQEVADEMIDMFPELEDQDDFEDAIREDINQKINTHLTGTDAEIRVIIKNGRPTDEIIGMMDTLNPDLMIIGKKTGYTGRGTVARRILRYVPSSILFVPETSRYQLDKVLVPVDFSEESARAVRAAIHLSEKQKGAVTAQHIYNYPARFFPYMPEDDDREKMENYLKQKKEEFINNHNIPGQVDFEFSLNIEGSKMDQIYDQTVLDQTDMIVAASKANKKASSIFREDFTDKMAYYRFGIPLLIEKNKENQKKFLKSLFG